MLCSETDGKLPAIHYEHLDTQTAGMIESFIQFFVSKCQGNGKLMLIISGGQVESFEPTSKVSNKASHPRKKARSDTLPLKGEACL